MKLYYLPGACSLATHIMLRESGIEPQLERIEYKTGKTVRGEDYLAISPLGYVPALAFEDGTVLTESTAILMWIADNLGPKPGDGLSRYRLLEELSFVAAELHKSFSPFFAQPGPEGTVRQAAQEKLRSRIAHYEHAYLGSEREFDVAQAYAFAVLSWAEMIDFDLAEFPRVRAFLDRIGQRTSVKVAREEEKAEVPA